MKTYFVTFRLYNGDNKGWAFKEEKFDDESVAMHKYGNLIETYYKKNPFTFGYIVVEDESGNKYAQIGWGKIPSVEPTEE